MPTKPETKPNTIPIGIEKQIAKDLYVFELFPQDLKLNNNKKFSICVIIENGGKGSVVPTKIAKKIFDYIIGIENV